MPIIDFDPGRMLSELQTDVRLLGFSSSSDADITTALNAAQRRVCGMRRWAFLERTVVAALAAGEDELSLVELSEEVTALDAIRFFDVAGNELQVTYVTYPDWRRYDQELAPGTTGTPQLWTRYRQSLLITPATDAALTMDVDCMIAPTPLVNATDRAVIPSNYNDVLVGGAASWLGMRLRDQAMIQMGEGLFTRTVQMMLAGGALAQRQNATSVSRSSHWSTYEWGKEWPTY